MAKVKVTMEMIFDSEEATDGDHAKEISDLFLSIEKGRRALTGDKVTRKRKAKAEKPSETTEATEAPEEEAKPEPKEEPKPKAKKEVKQEADSGNVKELATASFKALIGKEGGKAEAKKILAALEAKRFSEVAVADLPALIEKCDAFEEDLI